MPPRGVVRGSARLSSRGKGLADSDSDVEDSYRGGGGGGGGYYSYGSSDGEGYLSRSSSPSYAGSIDDWGFSSLLQAVGLGGNDAKRSGGDGGGGGGASGRGGEPGGSARVRQTAAEAWNLEGPRERGARKTKPERESRGVWSLFSSMLDDDGYSTDDYSYYTDSELGGILDDTSSDSGLAVHTPGRVSKIGSKFTAAAGAAKSVVARHTGGDDLSDNDELDDDEGDIDSLDESGSSALDPEDLKQKVEHRKEITKQFFEVKEDQLNNPKALDESEETPRCPCVYHLSMVFWRMFWVAVALGLVVLIVPGFTNDMYAAPDHQDFAFLNLAMPVNVTVSQGFFVAERDDKLAGRTSPALQMLLVGALPRKHKCTDASGLRCTFSSPECTCKASNRGLTCEVSYQVNVPANGTALLTVRGSALDGAVKNDDFCQVLMRVPPNVTLPETQFVLTEQAGLSLGHRADTRTLVFGGPLAINGTTAVATLAHVRGTTLTASLTEGRFEAVNPDFAATDVDTPESPITIETSLPADVRIETNAGPVCVSGRSVAPRDSSGTAAVQGTLSTGPSPGTTSELFARGVQRVWAFPQAGVAANASAVPAGATFTPLTAPQRVMTLRTNASQVSVVSSPAVANGTEVSSSGLSVVTTGLSTPRFRAKDALVLRKLFYPRSEETAHPDYDMIYVNITGAGAMHGDFVWASNRIFFVVNHGLLSTLSGSLIKLKTLRVSASLDTGFCPQGLPVVSSDAEGIAAGAARHALRQAMIGLSDNDSSDGDNKVKNANGNVANGNVANGIDMLLPGAEYARGHGVNAGAFAYGNGNENDDDSPDGRDQGHSASYDLDSDTLTAEDDEDLETEGFLPPSGSSSLLAPLAPLAPLAFERGGAIAAAAAGDSDAARVARRRWEQRHSTPYLLQASAAPAVAEEKLELRPARPDDARLTRLVDQLVLFDDLLGPFSSNAKVGFKVGCSLTEMFTVNGEEVDAIELRWTRSKALVAIVSLSLFIALVLALTCSAGFAYAVRTGLRSRRRDLKKSIGFLRGSGVIALANDVGVNTGQFAFMPFAARVAAEEESHFGELQREIQEKVNDGGSVGLATDNPFTGEGLTTLEKRDYTDARIKYSYLSRKQLAKAKSKLHIDDEIMIKSSRIYFCDSHNSTHLNAPEIFCFESSIRYGVRDPRTVVGVLSAVLTQGFSKLPVTAPDYKLLQPIWFKAIQKYSAEREGASEDSGDLKVTKGSKLDDKDQVAVFIDDWMGFFGLVADFIDATSDFLKKLASPSGIKRIGKLGDPDHIKKMQRKAASVASRSFKSIDAIKDAVRGALDNSKIIEDVAANVGEFATEFSGAAKTVGQDIGGQIRRMTSELHNFIAHSGSLARELYLQEHGAAPGDKDQIKALDKKFFKNRSAAERIAACKDLFPESMPLSNGGGGGGKRGAKRGGEELAEAMVKLEGSMRTFEGNIVNNTKDFISKTARAEKLAGACLEDFKQWKATLERIRTGVEGREMIDIMSEINGLVAITRTMFSRLESSIAELGASAVELKSAGGKFIKTVLSASTDFEAIGISLGSAVTGEVANSGGGGGGGGAAALKSVFDEVSNRAGEIQRRASGNKGGGRPNAAIARLAREVKNEADSLKKGMKRLRKSIKTAVGSLTDLGDKVQHSAKDSNSELGAAAAAPDGGVKRSGSRRGTLTGQDGGGLGSIPASAQAVVARVMAAVTAAKGDKKGGKKQTPSEVARGVMMGLKGPVVEALGIGGADDDDEEEDDDDDEDAEDSDADSDAEEERKAKERELEREKGMSKWRRGAETTLFGLQKQLQGFVGNGVWVLAHVFVMGLPTFILFWAAISLRLQVLQDFNNCTSYDQPIRAISLLAWAYFVVGLGELALHWALLPPSLRGLRIAYQRFFYVLLGLYTFFVFFFISLVANWMVLGLLIKPEEAISYVMGMVSVLGMIGTQAKRAKALVERLTDAMHEEITAQLRRIRVTVTRQERALFVKNSLMGLRLTGANIATAIFALLVAMSIVLAFVYLGMSVFSEPGTTQALFGSALSSLAGIAAIAKGRTTPEEQRKFDDQAVALVRTSIRAALEKLISAMKHLHAHVVEPITAKAREIAHSAQAKAQAHLDALDREAKRALKKGKQFVDDKVREAREHAQKLINDGGKIADRLTEEARRRAEETLKSGTRLVNTKSDAALRMAREQVRKKGDYVEEAIVAAEGRARAELDAAAELKRDLMQGGSVVEKLLDDYREEARTEAEDAKFTSFARASIVAQAAQRVADVRDKSSDEAKKESKAAQADLLSAAEYEANREALYPTKLNSWFKREKAGIARAEVRQLLREGVVGASQSGTKLSDFEETRRKIAQLEAAEAGSETLMPYFVRTQAAAGGARAEVEARHVAFEGADGERNVGDKITDEMFKTYNSKSYREVAKKAVKSRRESVYRLLGRLKGSESSSKSGDGGGGGGEPTGTAAVRRALLDLLTAASAWASDPVGTVTGSVKVKILGGAPEDFPTSVPAGHDGAIIGELLGIRDDLYITPSERSTIFDPPGSSSGGVAGSKLINDGIENAGNERITEIRNDPSRFINKERAAYEAAAKRLAQDQSPITDVARVRAELTLALARAVRSAAAAAGAGGHGGRRGEGIGQTVMDDKGQLTPALEKVKAGVLFEFAEAAAEVSAQRISDMGLAYRDTLVAVRRAQTKAEFKTALLVGGYVEAVKKAAETRSTVDKQLINAAGKRAMLRAEARAMYVTGTPRDDVIKAIKGRVQQEADANWRMGDMYVKARVLAAEAKAKAILEMGTSYVDRKINAAKREADRILDDGVAYVERKVAEAEASANLVLERVRSIKVMLPVFQLQKMHFAPRTTGGGGAAGTVTTASGFPDDPRGKTLRGLGKAVWMALVSVNLFQLEVRSSDGSICIKGVLPKAVCSIIGDVEAQINVEESRGRIDERGFLDNPIEISKEDIEEAKWEVLCEALENKYKCKRHSNGISVISW